VELRRFVGTGGFWDKGLLAREVLAEIPAQLTAWMKMRKIKPQNTGEEQLDQMTETECPIKM
jgi:hypothetical protein